MELRVVRHTDRFDEACRLYGDVLGWPVTREWPAGDGQGRGRIFGQGDTARLELIELLDGATPPPVTGVFVAVEHTDVATLRTQLLDAGFTLLRDVADQPWGHRNLAITDPTGLEVVFFQWLEQ